MPDMIPDDQVQLDTPVQAPVAQASSEPIPDHAVKLDSPSDEIPDDQVQQDSEKYNGIGQTAIAALEGARKGVLGPVADLLDKYMPDTNSAQLNQESAERAAEHPIAHGIGEVGGLLAGPIGAGAAALGGAGAAAVTANRIGAGAIKGMIETGLFQTSDELGKALMGQGDPNDAVSNVLAAAGAGGLLGGTFGAAATGLKKLAESKAGQAASNFLSDFGSQWSSNLHNEDTVAAVTNELNSIYKSTLEDNAATWGKDGLRAKNLAEAVPQMSEKIITQNNGIADLLQNKFSEMVKDPDAYPPRLVRKFQEAVLKYVNEAHDPNATPSQIFSATDDLKGWLQDYSKFDKQVGPLSAEKEFIDTVKGLSTTIRQGLEDKSVWGKAGQLQADTNSKFKAYLDARKDLVKRFTQKIDGVTTIDPGKVATYVKQAGKPNAILKQDVLNKFKSAAQTYRDHMYGLNENLGFDDSMMSQYGNDIKTPVLDGTLNNSPSAGTKAANEIFHVGSNKLARTLLESQAGHVIGTAAGGPVGGAAGIFLGPMIEPLVNLAARPMASHIKKYVVPTILKTFATENEKSIWPMVDYATMAARGAHRIGEHMENLFQKGGQQALEETVSDKERQKLRDFIENGGLGKEMDAQVQQDQNQPQPTAPQKFAEGGMVESPFVAPPDKTAAKPVLQGTDAISKVYPDHAFLLGSAKSRISNYLNSVRPQPQSGKAAFDDEYQDPEKEREFKNALDIAAKPLSVLDHAKKGTLTPDHVKHFNAMYPEIASQVNKKLTERIMKAQMDGERPTYSVRQSLSMLMSTHLDGVMSPQNIQAAQAVFAQQAAQRQAAPMKPKKGTSSLSKVGEQYQTATQAAEARQSAKG